jgi:hypothetical protein
MMDQPEEIALHLQNIGELLLSPELSLCRKRMLNKDAEEFIVEEATALSRHAPLKLKVYISSIESKTAQRIPKAVHDHFAYLKENSQKKLKHTIQFGFRSLLIAFLFLSVIFLLTELGTRFMPRGGLALTIRESLIIVGWVALWRPAELLLYEWYPFKRDVLLFHRLENSKVEVINGVSE